MEDIRDRGLSTRLNNIDEELEHKTNKLKRLRSEARGIKLLHHIFQERKEQMAREFVGPVESRMNEYLQAITGRDTRQLVLDENLSPDTLEVDGENVPYSDLTDWALSAGTKEQLFLSMRMSVARELAEDENQVLILDDVLGNTDPERHDRIKGLLRQETDHLQIFILTCNRSLYDDMSNARQIHLDRITNR